MVYTNMTTSPVHALQTINNLTMVAGIPLLSTGFLAVLWLVVFTRVKNREGTRTAISGAFFITCMIGIAFRYLGLITDEVGMGILTLLILSLIPLLNQR